MSERGPSLHDLETRLSIDDLADYHEAIDIQQEMMERARAAQGGK